LKPVAGLMQTIIDINKMHAKQDACRCYCEWEIGWRYGRYGVGAGNIVDENCSVFSLIDCASSRHQGLGAVW